MSDADGSGDEGGDRRRRLFLALLVLALAAFGAGVGTLVLDGDDSSPGVRTETATPTTTPATPDGSGNVSLVFLGNRTLVEASPVAPGTTGSTTREIRNDGDIRGVLAVANTSVVDAENGLTTPEARVDDSPNDGELSEFLEIRLAVEYPDGDSEQVFDGDGYVTLAGLEAANESIGDGLAPGAVATLVFEWRVGADAGNEIQSDRVTFDVVFQLRDAESAEGV